MRINYYFRKYDLIQIVSLILDVLTTRLRFSNARIIRRPMSIRGRNLIRIGHDFTAGCGLRLDAFSHKKTSEVVISIGDNVQVNDYVHIAAGESVFIGNNVLIASNVFITDHNHGKYSGSGFHDSPESIPENRGLSFSNVIIEDNVWIGEFVSVLPGVVIGKGSIIGTMSVVTKNIPPFSIAVGSPARVIKEYDFILKRWIVIP